MGSGPVQHWWNGQWGWARLDIYLERDDSGWRVRALQWHGKWGEDVWDDLTEEQGRRYVDHLLETAPGPPEGWRWRDIARAHRRYG